MLPNRNHESDPFKVHQLQVEENIKRMKRQNRLNIKPKPKIKYHIDKIDNNRCIPTRGHILRKNITTDIMMNTQDSTQPNYTTVEVEKELIEKDYTKLLQNTFKKQSNSVDLDRGKKISVFDFISLIKKDQPNVPVELFSNRVSVAFNEVISKNQNNFILNGNDSISNQSAHITTKFLEWFDIQKFKYAIPINNINKNSIETPQKFINTPINNNLKISPKKYPHNDEYKKGIDTICGTLYNQKYSRAIDEKMLYQMTHKIIKYNDLSKFMCAVEVKNLKNLKREVIILLKVDNEITISNDDFLALSDDAVFKHKFCSTHISVYTNWKIFQNIIPN